MKLINMTPNLDPIVTKMQVCDSVQLHNLNILKRLWQRDGETTGSKSTVAWKNG